MFSNFLYFIIALVIYSTSQLFIPEKVLTHSALLNSLWLNIFFVGVCILSFKRLKIKIAANPYVYPDQMIQMYISRLTLMAITVFAINLYAFKLPFFLSDTAFFNLFPTAAAILFLGLFLFYLLVIWNAAYDVQKIYFAGKLTKKEYIVSNVSFSVPALLPWFFISLTADLLYFLPWQGLKDLLNTTAGEIGFIAVFIVVVAIFGPALIQKLWNCKPLEPGETRRHIEQVCEKAGLKYADILKWELFGGAMMTAGVMGLVGRFRYILVTPALLNSLQKEEIDAVIMHEIGHIKKHHLLFYLLFFAGFMGCNFLFFEPIMLVLYVFEPVYTLFDWLGISKTNGHSILISGTLIGFFLLYFRYIFGFFMRNFERQADLHVYNFIPDATPLISTFYKISSVSRQSMDKPNWHHFSIGQRVRFMEKCQNFPQLIQKHHTKVKRLIIGYFIGLAMVAGFGYTISFGAAKENFGNFIAEKILYQQLEIDPENSDLYVAVGDYYYHKENYEQAIDAYENVLEVDPENVHALNNLAWLFATCPQKEFQDRHKALKYAQLALDLKKEAFVLDTYAEACFINNEVEKAVHAARQAIFLSKDKKRYYKDQLAKFETALGDLKAGLKADG